jgi:uncharacterized membrane protein YcaP (DUF421 family)
LKPFDPARLWIPELTPWEVTFRAAVMYLFIQALFRVAGRKAIGRWGVPEIALLFLVTTSARMSVVGDDPSLTSAMIALVTIVALDRLLSGIVARSPRAADLIEGPVRRLVKDGELQRATLARIHLSEEELLAKVREQGRERLDEVKDAFFERSGTITIVFRDSGG